MNRRPKSTRNVLTVRIASMKMMEENRKCYFPRPPIRFRTRRVSEIFELWAIYIQSQFCNIPLLICISSRKHNNFQDFHFHDSTLRTSAIFLYLLRFIPPHQHKNAKTKAEKNVATKMSSDLAQIFTIRMDISSAPIHPYIWMDFSCESGWLWQTIYLANIHMIQMYLYKICGEFTGHRKRKHSDSMNPGIAVL